MPQHIGIFPGAKSTGQRSALSVNAAGALNANHGGNPAVATSSSVKTTLPEPTSAPFVVTTSGVR